MFAVTVFQLLNLAPFVRIPLHQPHVAMPSAVPPDLQAKLMMIRPFTAPARIPGGPACVGYAENTGQSSADDRNVEIFLGQSARVNHFNGSS
jgi:hypothetical protein